MQYNFIALTSESHHNHVPQELELQLKREIRAAVKRKAGYRGSMPKPHQGSKAGDSWIRKGIQTE